MKKTTGVLLFFMTVSIGCGDDDPLDAAWSKFRGRDYAGAHEAFSRLIPGERQAYVGLGWTTLRQDSLDAADGYFTVIAGDSLIDAYAAWTALAWERGENSASVIRARFVLNRNPTYVFKHDRSITYHDVLIHEGYGELNLGNYTRVAEILERFDVTVTDNNPDTLLAALESLYATYGTGN
jgi:hypothetical protein